MSQQYSDQPQTGQHSQSQQPQRYQGTGQQQPQRYQPMTQAGQQFQGRTGGFVGQRFDQMVPQEVQAAIADLDRLENVAEWAKTKVAQRGMPQVERILADLADVAHLEKKLILRESPLAQPIGQAVQQTVQSRVQELQQYASEPEVQEALEHSQQTLSTIQQGISRLQQFGQQGQFQGQAGQQGQFRGQAGQQPTQYGQQY